MMILGPGHGPSNKYYPIKRIEEKEDHELVSFDTDSGLIVIGLILFLFGMIIGIFII